MLIVAGLLKANRFRPFVALTCGMVVLTWAQRLVPDRQPTLDPKQIVTSAWTHQLPLTAFGLAPKAMEQLEADSAAQDHDAEPLKTRALRFNPGEGWSAQVPLDTTADR